MIKVVRTLQTELGTSAKCFDSLEKFEKSLEVVEPSPTYKAYYKYGTGALKDLHYSLFSVIQIESLDGTTNVGSLVFIRVED